MVTMRVTGEEVDQARDQIEAEGFAMGPMVQVVLRNAEPRIFPFSDIALPDEGDDPAMISDDDLKLRCERWMDVEAGTLNGYKVTRPDTGNVLVSVPAVYG